MQQEKKPNTPSTAVIKRLARYYRYLRTLHEEGVTKINSKDFSELMNVTSSQIRQDLNCFGGFGQQGYGYNIEYLLGKIGEILGVNEQYRAIIIGIGRLGQAIASSAVFAKRGVSVCGLFDISDSVIGKTVAGIEVRHPDELERFISENKVDIAVLTLTAKEAHRVAETVNALGVNAFWNFTSTEIKLNNPSALVENVHMGDSLMTLCYQIRHNSEEGSNAQ